MWEHGWLVATACPSGRIPWGRLIAELEDDMPTEDRVREIAREEDADENSRINLLLLDFQWRTRATALALDGNWNDLRRFLDDKALGLS